MIQRFHIMTRVSSDLEMINNYSKPTIGWNPQRTGHDNRCISRRKGCPRSALFEVLDEGDDKRALREQCSLIHVMIVVVVLARASSRSVFVTRLEASSSLRASVMPSACAREKPRCSSFLMTLLVSSSNVCINRQCTSYCVLYNPLH